jgi:hypothetical protein
MSCNGALALQALAHELLARIASIAAAVTTIALSI